MGASDAAKRRVGHVQGWRRSGLTQAAYCEKHKLNRHTLAYWCSQTQRRKDRVSDTASAARFVPLRVKDAVRVEKDESVAAAALELWFPVRAGLNTSKFGRFENRDANARMRCRATSAPQSSIFSFMR